MSQQLIISDSTFLKASTGQASTLPSTDKVQVKARDVFELAGVKEATGNHVWVELVEPVGGRTHWCAYLPHVNIKGDDKGHSPIPGKAPDGKLYPPSEWRLNSIAEGIAHHFEGCELQSYSCPAGVWTIGWGNTRYKDGSAVQPGQSITQSEADELARHYLREFVIGVAQLVKVPLRGSAIAALVAFAYNVGLGAFAESTLLKRINEGYAVEELQYQLRRWCKAGGVPLAGLLARRNCEAAALAGLNWKDHTEDYTDHNA